MPLVVPGIQSNSGSSNNDWMTKLMGKKLGDSHDEITFAKEDLPKEHRVLRPDSMKTMDHKPERMNIHVDDDGTVKDIKFG
ncbi:hypothetical protein BDV95DRAFT_631581 [Massariosphaeria phaeospora]|uniref:Uncharacterized protein n=1 Tax=Massariosphaeria phaeospora TaxID=100035 RepID=A0A7C8M373_9PLEO|nr:hypothetical protein BDV95DRAFT_631581 [Massariosphaeria phaeospora]